MGGCRCTYKNCSLRTDGVTHMFHYPVFDKVRCHQWLTNAQKLEFLNLKVSQLKNRVVCQHHFRDDNFMNFRKDKLTFNAVPTLDGPYCDSSQLPEKKALNYESKLYSITIEDIENEYLTLNDKKANFSVKYGDFLTNGDLMDFDTHSCTENRQLNLMKDKSQQFHDTTLYENINRRPSLDERRTINQSLLNNSLDAMTESKSSNNVFTIQMSEVPIEVEAVQSSFKNPNINMQPSPTISKTNNKVNNVKHVKGSRETKSTNLKDKKIIILEEQNISDQLAAQFPVPIKLEPVCPSAILTLPNKKRKQDACLRSADNNIKVVAPDPGEINKIIEQAINIEEEKTMLHHDNNLEHTYNENVDRNMEQVIVVQSKAVNNVNNASSALNINNTVDLGNVVTTKNVYDDGSVISSSNVNTSNVQYDTMKNIITKSKAANNIINARKNNNSLIINRIPPERLAAIDKKRKFNMKLRDIIAECLDKLDDNESNTCSNTKVQSKLEEQITHRVSSYLAKEPDLPNIQEYAVTYLEARMNKMENILLKKIDQNSQRIMDLKNMVVVPSFDKKSVCTQTRAKVNEEEEKKELYHQISKYLSSEANSLLYEELFINKYVQKKIPCSLRKRRKYKR